MQACRSLFLLKYIGVDRIAIVLSDLCWIISVGILMILTPFKIAMLLASSIDSFDVILQKWSHVNAQKQETVRVQGGRMREIVLRRPILEEAHREPSQFKYGERHHHVASTRGGIRRRSIAPRVQLHPVCAPAHLYLIIIVFFVIIVRKEPATAAASNRTSQGTFPSHNASFSLLLLLTSNV